MKSLGAFSHCNATYCSSPSLPLPLLCPSPQSSHSHSFSSSRAFWVCAVLSGSLSLRVVVWVSIGMGEGGVKEEEERVVVVVVGEEEEEGRQREKLYPPRLVSQEEVARNPMVFMDTLRRFHSAMGTRFMIPVIGGKELDLHRLYLEVTQRGGLEKVIGGRRWREVIAAFNFPPTTTSASFVLRKYYISLLHHFEQVHLFGVQGPLVPPAAILQTKSPSPKLLDPHGSPKQLSAAAQSRKRAFADLQSKAAGTSFTVTGTIDGKFEHGYLVTVKLGRDTLHGVLYHAGATACSPPRDCGTVDVVVPGNEQGQRRRRKRRGWRRSRDPTHPKPNRSAYNFFFAKEHSKLKSMYPHREREFSRMIGESWNKLSPEERKVYDDCGMRDKERYKQEMEEYRERLKLNVQQPIQPLRSPDLSLTSPVK